MVVESEKKQSKKSGEKKTEENVVKGNSTARFFKHETREGGDTEEVVQAKAEEESKETLIDDTGDME